MTSLVTVFYTTGAAHLKGAVAAEQVHEVTYIQSIQGYTFSSHGQWPCMDNRAADTTALER